MSVSLQALSLVSVIHSGPSFSVIAGSWLTLNQTQALKAVRGQQRGRPLRLDDPPQVR